MSAPSDSLARFGVFELNLRTGELRKAGIRVNLPEQPFQVLKALVERPGELVTRDDLRQRLWPAETFVDFEHGLNAAVRRLRDALGDSAETPRFVETLPRRGYRFIAPVAGPDLVREPSPPSGGTDSESETSSPLAGPSIGRVRGPMPRPVLVAMSALVAAIVLLSSGLALRQLAASPTSSPSRVMLAVLPFDNLTGDADHEYVSDGMTEELIAQLGRIDPSRLGVIARQSAMQFKKTTKRAAEIGSDLGVSYLLVGSLRRTDSRIRVAVQLIDTKSESQLWGEQYEHGGTDLLALQQHVGEAVTRRIAAHVGVARTNLTADASRHSTNAEAYEHYLRGRHHLWRQGRVDGFEKAKEFFEKAIALDPAYAHAYSGLADTYTMFGTAGVLPMREAYSRARAAALNAIALDGKLAEAHTSLAFILADFDWDWHTADRHFKNAVELNPNYVTAVRTYSGYLSWWGRHQEALAFATRARDLDPVSATVRQNLGMVHYFARRYEDAIAEFREVLDLDPNFGQAHVMLGRTYAAMGSSDRAVKELERARDLIGARPDVITPTAYVLAKAGRRQEALATLDELRRVVRPRDPSPFRLGYVHLGLGDTDAAFDWLEKAVETRDWQLSMLKVEPAFDSVRSNPRFAALLERIGLPR